MIKIRCLVFQGAVILPFFLGDSFAQEWTRFRGPNGSGVSGSATAPSMVRSTDYNWKVKLPGKGHSSPVLWGRKLFVTSGDEKSGQRLVLCLDAESGREMWRRSFASRVHRKHSLNSFASSSPAVDEKRLYVCWATPSEYIVLALDHDGETLWRKDLGPFKTGHGFGVSPIVHGELVIVANEQEGQSNLVALERDSGRERWKLARDTRVTYSTPCVYRRDGRDELIFTNWSHGITGHDPKTGKPNWQIKVFSRDHLETAIGSPIVHGDLVLGVCGYLGKGNHVVAVKPEGDGAKEVYRIERGAPLSTTPVVAGGLLFLWSDEGIVTCADAASGKVHWRRRVGGTFYGSPVAVGGHLYCISADGELVVLEASKTYRLVTRHDLGEPSNSTPAVARGKMYLRTVGHLISIGGKR